jgi:uncharacterized membrane protein YqjE
VEPQPLSGLGPLASLRALGATLLELAGTRAELALVELREEGERRKEMLALALAGTLFLSLALLLFSAFVVALFWETHRLAAIGAMTLLYLGVSAFAFARLRGRVRASPPPFEATLRELAADRDMLRGHRE